MNIATEVPVETVLPPMKLIKLGSCVAHRPEVNSRRDERMLVIMMKAENSYQSIITCYEKQRGDTSGWSKKRCHAQLKFLERMTGVKRQMREIAKH